MPVQRILAGVALVAALASTAAVLLGSRNHRTEYRVRFAHAGLLVKGGDVLIGGQRVGTVRRLGLSETGEAEVTVSLSDDTPRLREGTTASLEEPSLSGQANRYVAINPGPSTAPALREGAVIDSAATTSVVELDQLYNLLDAPTRDGLRHIVRGHADVIRDRRADAERFYETFNPALQASDRLFRELAEDRDSLRRFVGASAILARTLRAGSDDLNGTVDEAAQATAGFARAADDLELGLRRLPGTLGSGRRGLAALRRALPQLDALVARARPALRGLPAFAGDLAGALRRRRALELLAELVHGPRANDDLVELFRELPRLTRRALPSFRASRVALRDGKPLIDQFRPYTPDLIASWGNTGRAVSLYDANGHYARVLPQFGAFEETAGGAALSALSPGQRTLGPQTGQLRRCPGAATQPAGGAPLSGSPLECLPKEVPLGP
jgi:phospholipid/cholesterol/gamma-HCH transport system substrate-binding protein